MKPSLRVFGLILSCLLVVFITACAREGDDRVGTYTLVRGEVELEGIIVGVSPPDITGTLNLTSDRRFTMTISSSSGTESGSGTWNTTSLTTDVGNTVPYSFNGNTIEFTLSVEGINFTYVWQKS